jgi:hypothetical protein
MPVGDILNLEDEKDDSSLVLIKKTKMPESAGLGGLKKEIQNVIESKVFETRKKFAQRRAELKEKYIASLARLRETEQCQIEAQLRHLLIACKSCNSDKYVDENKKGQTQWNLFS